MSEALRQALPRLLEPATTELTTERLDGYVAAVGALAVDLSSHEYDAVHAGHGILTDPTRAWLAKGIREKNPEFVAEGKDALLCRIAAAMLLHAPQWADPDAVILADLATESAKMLGLPPVVAELQPVAEARLREAGRQVRERADSGASAAASLGKLPPERKPTIDDDGEEVPVDSDALAADLAVVTKALKAAITRVDQRETAAAARQAALDEEVEVLWWAILERSENGTPWAELAPLARAVQGAHELDARTLLWPGLPSSAFFLGRLLGDDASTAVSLREVVVAAADFGELIDGHDRLLPVSTALGCWREVEGDAKLWPGLAKKKFGIDVGLKTTLESAAAQLYREAQMLNESAQ